MRRGAAILALTAAALALGGCVYDPYSGLLLPCCGYYGYGYGYGYPYAYRYPAPYSPYGYPTGPYGAPQAGQPSPYQGQPGAATSLQGGTLAQRFAAANVTHDGRLTREQAQAGMPLVAENFDAIDIDQKGYVTLPEIRTFVARQRAAGGQLGPYDAE
jgi:hypothetical protein